MKTVTELKPVAETKNAQNSYMRSCYAMDESENGRRSNLKTEASWKARDKNCLRRERAQAMRTEETKYKAYAFCIY